jgi:hypothetical protein
VSVAEDSCPDCGGMGACPRCGGSGGGDSPEARCPQCLGSGDCPRGGGEGVLPHDQQGDSERR